MRGLAAALLGVALLATPSSADLAGTPMTASGGRQDGTLLHATDVRADGRACVATHAIGAGAYPDPVLHDGSGLTWRVADPRRPRSVTVTREMGMLEPAGAEAVRATLEPVRLRGRTVAWLVRTQAVGFGDVRLTLTVQWPKERCGTDSVSRRYRTLSLPV